MSRTLKTTGVFVIVLLWAAVAAGQAPRPASRPAGVATSAPADSVAVTVNKHAIMESDIDAMLQQGRPMSPSQLAQIRERYRDRVLEMLIDNWLLDDQVKKANITVTDQEMAQEMEKGLQAYLASSGTTREEYEERVRAQANMSLKDFLAERVANPNFKRSVLHARLFTKKFPDEMKVTDEEISAYYEKNRERAYDKPAEVRASHILIGTKEAKTPEEKEAAKKKAAEVLLEVKKPGADFAALAQQHSSCPSKDKGGDLGFFPREGMMDPAFSAAAFALKIGEISDVVETRFGYHIIKATDHKEATTIPLAKARDAIREQLERQKTGELNRRYLDELKATAKIVYPPGKEPKPTSQPANLLGPKTRPAGRSPSTRPATKAK